MWTMPQACEYIYFKTRELRYFLHKPIVFVLDTRQSQLEFVHFRSTKIYYYTYFSIWYASVRSVLSDFVKLRIEFYRIQLKNNLIDWFGRYYPCQWTFTFYLATPRAHVQDGYCDELEFSCRNLPSSISTCTYQYLSQS